jgi:hypothetical protein
MRKLFFSLFSMIIFSGVVLAQTENNSGCQKFKMTIIAPLESTDFKLVVKQPNDKFEFKDVVIDPCRTWALPKEREFDHIVQWGLPLPHPFIELSRAKLSPSTVARLKEFRLPNTNRDYKTFDLKLEIKF